MGGGAGVSKFSSPMKKTNNKNNLGGGAGEQG